MFKFYRNLDFSKKFLVILLPLCVLAFLTITLLSVNKSTELLEKEVLKSLEKINSDFHANSHKFYDDVKHVLLSLEMQNVLKESYKTGDYTGITARLKQYKERYEFINDIGIADLNGKILADAVDTAVGLDLSSRPFFTEIKQGRDFYIDRPGKSEVTGQTNIFFSHSVKDQGNITGVIICAVNWDYFLKKYVDPVKVGDTGYGYITDIKGLVLGHPVRKNVLDLDISPYDFGKEILANSEGYIEYTWQGEPKWVVYKKDNIKEWYFAVGVNKAEVLGGVSEIKNLGVIVLISFSLLFVFVIIIAAKRMLSPLGEFKEKFTIIGNGDLRERVAYESEDELGVLASQFNEFILKIKNLIEAVKEKSEDVSSGMVEISSAAEELASTVEEQSLQAQSVGTAVQELAATSSDISEAVDGANETVETSSKLTVEGSTVINELINALTTIQGHTTNLDGIVSNLGKSTDQIGKIVDVINDVADQTNLLALNAAIEAARAGDAGRGFAVVADEVRKLAERTGKATKEIEEIIIALQSESGHAEAAMEEAVLEVSKGTEHGEKTLRILDKIVKSSESISEQTSSVATAITQENATIDEVNNNIQGIAAGSEESANAVSEVATTAENLSAGMEKLKALIDQFTT